MSSHDSSMLYPHEPAMRWDLSAFSDFLIWAAKNGASDIKMAPRRPIWIRRDGRWQMAGRRDCYGDEISAVVNDTARANDASEQAITGTGYDYAYEVVEGSVHAGALNFDPKAAATKRYRFRACATGCRDGLATGIELTMRALPDAPPTVEQLGLPDAIVENCAPLNGLVVITGTMGSGKTTSLAALLRHINENEPRSIATFEQPIEFDLQAGGRGIGPVAQTEVPRMFMDFANAPRNATRRAQDIALFGESRDRETVDSMLEMAEVGSLVFTTLHTRSVVKSPDRIINMFPERERPRVAVRFAAAIRLIVYQRLVERLDPETGQPAGRIALIEYLPITAEMNSELSRADSSEYGEILSKAMVAGQGRTLASHAQSLRDQGLISESDYQVAMQEEVSVA